MFFRWGVVGLVACSMLSGCRSFGDALTVTAAVVQVAAATIEISEALDDEDERPVVQEYVEPAVVAPPPPAEPASPQVLVALGSERVHAQAALHRTFGALRRVDVVWLGLNTTDPRHVAWTAAWLRQLSVHGVAAVVLSEVPRADQALLAQSAQHGGVAWRQLPWARYGLDVATLSPLLQVVDEGHLPVVAGDAAHGLSARVAELLDGARAPGPIVVLTDHARARLDSGAPTWLAERTPQPKQLALGVFDPAPLSTLDRQLTGFSIVASADPR